MELLRESNRSDGGMEGERATARKCFLFGGDLGSGGISLVGAVEGAAAELAAVDSVSATG